MPPRYGKLKYDFFAPDMNIVIPCAGLGSRFKESGILDPKPLIEVLGKTLIEYSIKSFDVEGQFLFITREFEDKESNLRLSALLRELRPESTEIRIDHVTSGAAETVLKAREYINTDEPLVVYNCDQSLLWDEKDFLKWVKNNDPDGAVVVYESEDPKNSFAKINKLGLIEDFAEKKAISSNALVGFHYWKRGRDFVRSADKLMENFHDQGSPECYISETYNYIDLPNIRPYHIANHHYVPLGTPTDVAKYVGKSNEYTKNKPSTIFVDIDGTLLKHQHAISCVYQNKPKLLKGVRAKLDEWDSIGHCIILVTARKESARKITEKHLEELAIPYDKLIMGVSSGLRIIINDKQEEQFDRATAVNVITDQGFEAIDWEAYAL